MKNIILIKRCFFAMAVLLTMACLSACSVMLNENVASAEEKTQQIQKPVVAEAEKPSQETDLQAPEGDLKGHFLIASQKVLPEDFLENVTDDSQFQKGFRNIRKLYDEPEMKKILEREIKSLDIAKETVDFDKIFDLGWNVEKDCYEEKGNTGEALAEVFEPEESGLYELEVAASDIYGNISAAKVYVLWEPKNVSLSEFEAYVGEVQLEREQAEESETASRFDREKAEEAFAKVNEQRKAYGIQALVWDEGLYELSCIRAKEIVTSFSHQRPDGSYVGDVIIREYGAAGCGENIASHYASTTNLINGWLNSQGHKENMLNSAFTAGVMGCCFCNGSYYWVNLFKQ